MGVLFAFWSATAVCVAAIAIASAWDAREDAASAAAPTPTIVAPTAVTAAPTAAPTATPEPRPRLVPLAAEPLRGDFDSGAPEQHLFFHLDCAGGVLLVITTDEQVYAETVCPATIEPVYLQALQGVPVRLTVAEGQLEISTRLGARLTFPIGRAWIVRD
jgi:hypothetical protein